MSLTPEPIDQRINPIEAFIYKGFADRFYEVFGVALTYTTSQDKKTARDKQLGMGAKYPMAFAVLKTFTIDETRYSPKTLFLRGVTSQASSDNMLTYKAQFLPTIITFEITVLSQDIKEITALAKEWLFAAVNGYLKFSISFGVVGLDIASDLDREVTIPDKKTGLTDVNEYEMIATLRIAGYLSPDNLSKVQAITSVETTGLVGDRAHYAALEAAEAAGGQAFLFKSRWNSITGPSGSSGDPKTTGP